MAYCSIDISGEDFSFRRPIPIDPPDDGALYAGIDFGGTNIKIGFVRNKKIEARASIPTLVDQGPEQAIQRTANQIIQLTQCVGGSRAIPAAVGIGVPGLVEGRVLKGARNFPRWNDVPLCDRLERYLAAPTYLETDARVAAIGEIYAGICPPVNRGVVLTLGTGVGGATFERYGNCYVLGSRTSAIGLTVCHDDGRLSGDRHACYIEDLISAPAIKRRARAYREQLHLPPPHPIDAKTVVEWAESGDAACLEVVEDTGRYLGLLLVNIVHLFNPQEIVIGGGVGAAKAILIVAAQQILRKFAVPILLEPVKISFSHIGLDCGIYGAAFLAALSGGQ
jgi:glucokinase